MKKFIYLILISFFLFGCSNLNSKLESAVSKEAGKKPTNTKTRSKTKTQIFIWENVSIGKTNLIKNAIDKSVWQFTN
ncbi:MAG: hypothetical protein ACYC2P_07440 [Paludibacteraceae bacterium]